MFAMNALASKTKAMYGKRLKANDYEALLKMNHVSEVAGYLKQQSEYQSGLQDVRESSIHRGQLEALIRQSSFLRLQKLLRYVDLRKEPFYRFVIMEEEVNQLLSCIRSLKAKEYQHFINDLPLFLNEYTSFDLSQLIQVKKEEDLWEIVKKTQYASEMKRFLCSNENFSYPECENAMKRYVYETTREMALHCHSRQKKELIAMLDRQIELKNISCIYRMKEFFHADSKTIKKQLITTHSRWNQTMMERLLAAKDGKEVLALLAQSPYRQCVGEKDFVYIEYGCSQIQYYLGKRFLYFSNQAALVFFSYYLLNQIEVENIITIIEGVRYQISSNNIAKLLIYERRQNDGD